MKIIMEVCNPEKGEVKMGNSVLLDVLNNVNVWLKSGKVLSVFDLRPMKQVNKFENNLSSKVEMPPIVGNSATQ